MTFLGESIDKVHKYYGTDSLEDAMRHIHSEMSQFGHINWLPILEVCVTQNYLPDNILDICMNYFLWKGDLKTSAEFARVIRFWRNKGLNDEWVRNRLVPLSEYAREFSALEEVDNMKKILTKTIDKEIFIYNTSYLYTGLKTLYYSGYLENIMLMRIFYSSSILFYSQMWEFGVRKLKYFTSYNSGIKQEWINVYFSTIDENSKDEDLYNHILPVNPSLVERRNDKFLILGFNRIKGNLIRMLLLKQYSDRKFPAIIWRNEMFVN